MNAFMTMGNVLVSLGTKNWEVQIVLTVPTIVATRYAHMNAHVCLVTCRLGLLNVTPVATTTEAVITTV